MRKLVIASLLVAGVSLSGLVLAQQPASQAAMAKSGQAAAAPATKTKAVVHHHMHKAVKKTAEKPASGK
jgi:hypothetical protein